MAGPGLPARTEECIAPVSRAFLSPSPPAHSVGKEPHRLAFTPAPWAFACCWLCAWVHGVIETATLLW